MYPLKIFPLYILKPIQTAGYFMSKYLTIHLQQLFLFVPTTMACHTEQN